MGAKCRSKKIDWGPTAIVKSRDAGGLDYGRSNEDGKMSSDLGVFCRRADRFC